MAQEIKTKLSAHRVGAISVIVAITALLVVGVGAWAYDSSQKDQIAPGVTIGGVDVGGKSEDQARQIVRRQVVAPLRQPVTVTYDGKEYRLTASELHQRADVQGMLDDALDRSREGGIVTRMGRYMSGGEVNADIPAEVTYSQKAVDDFVNEVADDVDQDPVDATVTPSGDSLTPQPGHDGVELREAQMTALITRQLDSPTRARTLRARVKLTHPEVTKAELADAYPTYVLIDRASYHLLLFKHLRLKKTYAIAVGQAGLETPAGLYTVQDKQVNPWWHVPDSAWAGDLAGADIPPGPDNPLQARWIGIADGAGIHGTTDTGSLGSAASHGCVRMSIPDVIELYDEVPMGTPIYVE